MFCGLDFSPLQRTKWNQHSLPRSQPQSHSPYPTSLQHEDLSFSHSFPLYPVPGPNRISLALAPHSQGRSNHHQIPHSELWGPQMGLNVPTSVPSQRTTATLLSCSHRAMPWPLMPGPSHPLSSLTALQAGTGHSLTRCPFHKGYSAELPSVTRVWQELPTWPP